MVLWDALRHIVCEINYGGRITDEWDRRLLRIILNRFCNPDVLIPGYKFSKSPNYFQPTDSSSLEKIRDYINSLPEIDKPELFGVHENNTVAIHISELQ